MRTHRNWKARGLMLLAAAVILGGFAWLGSDLMAADKASGQQENTAQQLKEIRSLLADQSKHADDRINQALTMLDDAINQANDTTTTTGPRGTEPLIPSQAQDPNGPFQGMTIFKGDPFFDNQGNGGSFDPFQEMQRMHDITNQMFSNAFQQWRANPQYGRQTTNPTFAPSMDISESDDTYTVKVDLPGLSRDDINVEVSGQVLTVSGKRDTSVQQKDKDGHLIRQEREAGQFQRSMTLPGPVQTGKIDAKYDNGVLTIILPKKAEQRQGSQLVPIK